VGDCRLSQLWPIIRLRRESKQAPLMRWVHITLLQGNTASSSLALWERVRVRVLSPLFSAVALLRRTTPEHQKISRAYSVSSCPQARPGFSTCLFPIPVVPVYYPCMAHMLDVEGGSLQRLVHAAVFTTTSGPALEMPRHVPLGHYCGARPSNCRAVARTSASVSLGSTSASNSTDRG
jgi:hypothetical protein